MSFIGTICYISDRYFSSSFKKKSLFTHSTHQPIDYRINWRKNDHFCKFFLGFFLFRQNGFCINYGRNQDSKTYALAIYGKKQLSFQLCYISFTMVRSLHCPSKNFFLFSDAIFLEILHCERAHGHGKKRQHNLNDSSSIPQIVRA